MSLAKLLSTGKSLVGGATDNANRYRMGNPGLLPKFGSVAKPVEHDPKWTASPGVASDPIQPTLEAKQKKPEGQASRKKESAMRGIYQSWLSWIKARFSRIYVKPARRDVPRFRKAPVQVELSLDKVRVVRNDLSDTDLEIVPGRKESQPSRAIESSSGKATVAETDSVQTETRELTTERK